MLSSTFVRSKAGLVPVVLAALILAACSGRAPQTPPPTNIQDEASANSDYYLQQLQQSSDDNKADWQLLAIRALLREGKLPQAAEQLGTLPANMSGTQRQEQQLLTAELLVAQKNNPAATDILGKLDATQLSANQQVRFYQAQIAANQGKATLPLIRAFIAQEPLLKDKAHQDNIDGTWQGLAQLTPQELNNIIINADENVLQGWLDLLHVYQDNKQDPDLLKAGIKDWQNRYPQNPAAKNLPTALTQVSNFSQASTAKIALLLPLSGSAQVFADAIQQGFTAAQNGLPVNTPAPVTPDATATTPTDATATPVTDIATPAPVANPVATSNAQVKIYDTTTQPVAALLAQAQQDGATLVVGPLLKAEVEQLSTPPSTLNILALNQPEVSTNSQNICYFALSPEDEARDAAHHLWSQEKRMPLLLTPRGAFGDRVAKAFAEEWQKQGGQTVLQQNFGSTAELKQTINSGAGIRLAGQPVSVSSAPASVTIAGLTIPAPPVDAPVVSTSAGGNIDAVYIIATPAELTLIKPMIDMATSTRSKPALFASSRSYQAGAGPDYRLEMEGIQFSDIPLMAGANPALMQQAAAKFANDYSLVRLYAMGIDAWTLSNHFAEMRQIPGFQVSGTTGDLTASADCVITRKLPWLQYRQGMVVPAA
ncbi:TPA: penicillin-binding protein activator [Yersinia enterocolitica]|uniref:Penicillin-binding protein activator LpoA n=2 Tax=Yersinia enterocolitica TaxID=630 RepID=A0A0H3NQW2_YERE1|nr:penicillin-binding protein activator [Yersinia enterocolitica]EKN3316240.1 penicillin-binding protein activator [Yersinia enterocolitica]EKN3320104.1 penicillin-binding protein activator [Yersinia enterocolitica]EKN3324027.1 penicillin-binding protein activator [Yersinia enterocolitica]EKN3336041.1 penicillin-binding protein activator [Yersinia enterocolitica]EKN3356042.1 penicillin-binding protein activator [Yersinia enterocolitica]